MTVKVGQKDTEQRKKNLSEHLKRLRGEVIRFRATGWKEEYEFRTAYKEKGRTQVVMREMLSPHGRVTMDLSHFYKLRPVLVEEAQIL